MSTIKHTVLHADDVARWQRHVQNVLSDFCDVKCANDYDSMLSELERGQYDLLILDNLMPGTGPLDDACSACAHIRKQYPDLLVIVYTGAWQDNDVNRDELEQKLGRQVVFKDVRDRQKDDLRAQVSKALESGT